MTPKRYWQRRSAVLLSLLLLWLSCALPTVAAEDDRLTPPTRTAEPPTASQPPPTGALPADTRYIGQTGHYLRGPFLRYWLDNGGAARFGYPISEEYATYKMIGGQHTLQLFDNARFEYDAPDHGPARLTLTQLGRDALGDQTFPPLPAPPTGPNLRYFPETGHSIVGNYLATWQAAGGLSFLGYPLSEQIPMAQGSLQHFERGRLEVGAAGYVEIAPVGAELLTGRGWAQPERLSLNVSTTTPGQGTTIIATLTADQPLTVLNAQYGPHPVNFASTANRFTALIGIGPDESVGLHTLTVTAQIGAPANLIRPVSVDLNVQETPFPHDRVYLPPDQNDLLDPAVAAREAAIVNPLYETFTAAVRWSGPFLLPATGPITTEFGEMRAYNDGPYSSWHNGLDIGAPEGAPIIAPAPGRVLYTGTLPIRGNFTMIDHGRGVFTCYFHQSAILVQAGQEVNTGDLLGRVGTTGLSTGAHLHWEVRIGSTPVSPWQWVQGLPPIE